MAEGDLVSDSRGTKGITPSELCSGLTPAQGVCMLGHLGGSVTPRQVHVLQEGQGT